MPQRPEIARGLPDESCSVPRDAPVVALNALIRPSPKFPTSSAPPNAPQFAGAMATPHGEFSGPFEIKCFVRLPFRSKTATKPFPTPPASRNLFASCFAYSTYRLLLRFQMLKGAKPAGTEGSLNVPTRVTGA